MDLSNPLYSQRKDMRAVALFPEAVISSPALATLSPRSLGSRTQCGHVEDPTVQPECQELPASSDSCQGRAGHPRACAAKRGQASACPAGTERTLPVLADGGGDAGKAGSAFGKVLCQPKWKIWFLALRWGI